MTTHTTHRTLISFTATCAVLFCVPVFAQASKTIDLTINGTVVAQTSSADLNQFVIKHTLSIHDPSYTTEIEKFQPCIISDLNPCLLTHTTKEAYTTRRITTSDIDEPSIVAFLKQTIPATRTKSINAKFQFNPETKKLTVIEDHAHGTVVDIRKSAHTIATILTKPQDQWPKSIELSVMKDDTAITAQNVHTIGIKEKIGTGKSNFAGSPRNRIYNIGHAVKKFHGVLIAPDEEFSFVETLGDVDKSTGYKEELVIKNNETIPEYGGGICQISTTLFRAILNTGLKVTERRNHAYPVSYYSPQGTDATIYIPHPDLRFVNNTGHYVLLQAHIDGTILTFDIYGTNDGRTVEVGKPVVFDRNSFYDNPAKYHKDKEEIFTKKPKDWSNKQWKKYRKEHNL